MNIIDQLRRDEGESATCYLDHLGYQTIGVGRLIDKRRGGGLRPDEVSYLLNNDIQDRREALKKALPFFGNLSSARQGVLINMAFQLGTAGLLEFKQTLKLIEGGDWAGASKAMVDSTWARQTPARAARLAKQMETNLWQ
jgi:lysozyme